MMKGRPKGCGVWTSFGMIDDVIGGPFEHPAFVAG